jgi:hypothetical protein
MTVVELSNELSLTEPDVQAQVAPLVDANLIKQLDSDENISYVLKQENLDSVSDLMEEAIADRSRDDIDDEKEETEEEA